MQLFLDARGHSDGHNDLRRWLVITQFWQVSETELTMTTSGADNRKFADVRYWPFESHCSTFRALQI